MHYAQNIAVYVIFTYFTMEYSAHVVVVSWERDHLLKKVGTDIVEQHEQCASILSIENLCGGGGHFIVNSCNMISMLSHVPISCSNVVIELIWGVNQSRLILFSNQRWRNRWIAKLSNYEPDTRLWIIETTNWYCWL